MTQSKPSGTKGPNPFDALNAIAGFNPQAARVWQDIMTENTRFAALRFEKAIASQKASIGCKSPAELAQVQTRFLQEALADYAEGSSRILKLMPHTGGTARSYDDVPL